MAKNLQLKGWAISFFENFYLQNLVFALVQLKKIFYLV